MTRRILLAGTLVTYESGPRLLDSLRDMAHVLGGGRPAAVTRELTKMYEEVRRETLDNLVRHYEDIEPPKGEIVIVIGPGEKRVFTDKDIQERLSVLLENLSVRDAAGQVADETGISRKQAYEFAIMLQKEEK